MMCELEYMAFKKLIYIPDFRNQNWTDVLADYYSKREYGPEVQRARNLSKYNLTPSTQADVLCLFSAMGQWKA